MNRLLRTLTIAAIIILSVTTLAPAQGVAPGLAAPKPGPAPSASAPDRIYEDTAPSKLAGVYSTRGRSSGYGMSSSYRRSSSSPASRSKRQIFIIPAAEIEREDHLAIERDIHVMSHILDRVLKKPVNRIGGVFTVMDDFFGRDSHVTRVIYADGYGSLFFMDVDFALVGPPPAPEAKEPNEPEEPVDSTWKQAERELYAPANVMRSTEIRSGPQYDAEKVELLKKNLVETLKHAANIQALRSDESVILTVTGRAIMSAKTVRRGKGIEWVFHSGRWVPATKDTTTASYPTLAPSVLTIRAKKSDIDAFSKGEQDFNEFYKRTQLLVNWSGSTGTTLIRGTTSVGINPFGR